MTDNLMTSGALSLCMNPASKDRYTAGTVFLMWICLALILTGVTGSVSAAPVENRIPTMISIALDPADPQPGQSFYITGTLITSKGEPLGNKWVVLESTAAGATPGKFQYLKVTRTERDGTYSFFRPAASPPEDLQVRFRGLYPYAASVSDVVTAKK